MYNLHKNKIEESIILNPDNNVYDFFNCQNTFLYKGETLAVKYVIFCS